MAFHFVAERGGVVEPNNSVARMNVERVQRSDDLVALGAALHTYADTWGHMGFVGGLSAINRRPFNSDWGVKDKVFYRAGPIGHIQAAGEPDEPFRRVDDAMDAAWNIYRVLVEESAQRGNQPAFTFSEIEPLLRRAFETEGDVDERCEVWANLIDERFGDRIVANPDFDDMPPAWVSRFEAAIREQQQYVLTLQGVGGLLDDIDEDVFADESGSIEVTAPMPPWEPTLTRGR